MKEWKNPELWTLGAEYTEAGGNGGSADNVQYDVTLPPQYGGGNIILIGTSGPALPLPIHK